MLLSVEHKQIEMIRFEIDHLEVDHTFKNNRYQIELPEKTCNVNVYFEPWKIKPLIRIDNHLCNYGMANFSQFDHMIEIPWSPNFFEHYFQSIIQSKTKWFEKLGEQNIIPKIGIDVEYKDLVSKIQDNLK